MHFAWDWLSLSDLSALSSVSQPLLNYAKLRHDTFQLSVVTLSTMLRPLDPHHPAAAISTLRASHLASILLLCDFNTGAFIRLLGHHYTGNFLDYDAIDDAITALSQIPHIHGEPKHDFIRTKHLFHHGFPDVANYSCDRAHTLERNHYDNHSSILPNIDIVLEKTALDISKSYAIALPRWILHFLDGLHLNAVGLVTKMVNDKTKHRVINDPSTAILGPLDSGALNHQMDKNNHTEVPPVFFGSAQRRILHRCYNLRISEPNKDIIIYKDDLVSAFRRIRYNPDISVAYAYVLTDFLILPIGGLFGPRNTPGWFCGTSELRAFASQHLVSLQDKCCPIIEKVSFADHGHTETLAPAFRDSVNPGCNSSAPGSQPVFVDDTIMIEYREFIRQAASASVLSANLFFGSPSEVEAPISIDKFMPYFGALTDTLGLDIDSRNLLVIYPDRKRRTLLALLNSAGSWEPSFKKPIRLLAKILGHVRHIAQILPLGVYLSLHLQLVLTDFLRLRLSPSANFETFMIQLRTVWGKYTQLHVSPQVCADMKILIQFLESADTAHIWRRPIGLLIPRDPHFILLSDASTKGLGGYCDELQFQWRLFSPPTRSEEEKEQDGT